MKLAIITGADGGMGTEITRAVATAGYKIIMACYRPEKAERVKDILVHDTGNPYIEVLGIDLASLASVAAFAERMLKRGCRTIILGLVQRRRIIIALAGCEHKRRDKQ